MSVEHIKPGAAAPDFTMPDQEGNERTLSEFTGTGKPTVLFFYCVDWSPVCTPELASLTEKYSEVSEVANIVGISVNHRWSHTAYSDHLGLPFPILSDWGGEVTRAYGLWLEAARIAKRSTVYLNADGTVNDVELSEIKDGRDIDAIIAKAKSIA